jgi:UDP-N-acetylmuramate dehydrogenase
MSADLFAALQKVARGTLQPNAPLAAQSWFRVGGNAELLFKPLDVEDLQSVLAATPPVIPVTVLGVASNLIIRDGGVPGLTIRLGPQFSFIKSGDTQIIAGAAALDVNVAKAAAAASLTGLEFLSGIPGSIGGGVFMNAGAYGREIKDVLQSATLMTRAGEKIELANRECGFRYRHSQLPDGAIVVAATLAGERGHHEAINARMKEIQAARAASQPIREKTGGSTFANPDGHKAWQLIDAAGCRGLRVGGAMMSELHCNFMINTGSATATDLENLGEEVRARVKNHTGIELRWEIKRVGVP